MSTSKSGVRVKCAHCRHYVHLGQWCDTLGCECCTDLNGYPRVSDSIVIPASSIRTERPFTFAGMQRNEPADPVASHYAEGQKHPYACVNCRHEIRRLSHQWRCDQQCHCTMQGCCPSREPVGVLP